MRYLAALFIFIFLKTCPVQGQPDLVEKEKKAATSLGTTTQLFLKNDTQFWGKLTGWRRDDSLFLTVDDGQRLGFSEAEVLRVKQFEPHIISNNFNATIDKKDLEAMPAEVETAVFLKKNRGVIRGRAVEICDGEHIVLMTRDSLLLKFEQPEIARIKQFLYGGTPAVRRETAKKVAQKAIKTYQFRERGWYNATNYGVFANGNGSGPFNNFTFSNATGFQMNRTGGIGLGFGVNKYGDFGELTVVPVFVEYRGYLRKNRFSPFFLLMFGHGFPVALNGFDELQGFSLDMAGGSFISPNIGCRIGSNRHGNFTIDIGAHLQQAGFLFSNGTDRFGDDRLYRRVTLRFGVVF